MLWKQTIIYQQEFALFTKQFPFPLILQIYIVPIKTWSFNRNMWRLLTLALSCLHNKSQSTIFQVVYNIDISGQWLFWTYKSHMVIYSAIHYRTRSNVNYKTLLLVVPLWQPILKLHQHFLSKGCFTHMQIWCQCTKTLTNSRRSQ